MKFSFAVFVGIHKCVRLIFQVLTIKNPTVDPPFRPLPNLTSIVLSARPSAAARGEEAGHEGDGSAAQLGRAVVEK
jgi:hypothetical protein